MSFPCSVGHEIKSFERCKAILVSRVFGGFRVSREYLRMSAMLRVLAWMVTTARYAS
jgi:hypothetical protein